MEAPAPSRRGRGGPGGTGAPAGRCAKSPAGTPLPGPLPPSGARAGPAARPLTSAAGAPGRILPPEVRGRAPPRGGALPPEEAEGRGRPPAGRGSKGGPAGAVPRGGAPSNLSGCLCLCLPRSIGLALEPQCVPRWHAHPGQPEKSHLFTSVEQITLPYSSPVLGNHGTANMKSLMGFFF